MTLPFAPAPAPAFAPAEAFSFEIHVTVLFSHRDWEIHTEKWYL